MVVGWDLLEKGEKGKGRQLAEMLRAAQVERAGSRDGGGAGYPLPLLYLHPGKTLHLGWLSEAPIGLEEAAPQSRQRTEMLDISLGIENDLAFHPLVMSLSRTLWEKQNSRSESLSIPYQKNWMKTWKARKQNSREQEKNLLIF